MNSRPVQPCSVANFSNNGPFTSRDSFFVAADARDNHCLQWPRLLQARGADVRSKRNTLQHQMQRHLKDAPAASIACTMASLSAMTCSGVRAACHLTQKMQRLTQTWLPQS